MAAATIAPVIAAGAIAAGLVGAIPIEAMRELALAVGEDGGMITFGAMLLASPVQWATHRTQVAVRKYLAIMFFLLAVSNSAMFIIESGLVAAIGAPFLIAGAVAMLLSIPLALTSTRWSQRALGMRRWRLLHRLTYVIAVALVAHVVLIGEFGLGSLLIVVAAGLRIPAIRRRIVAFGERRRQSRSFQSGIAVVGH
jgi:DMSO/TMAO reductase YedYZ heme-binding membrane subunit